MIESTSSWTKASPSKPNFLTANAVIAERKLAPGISECLSSQALPARAHGDFSPLGQEHYEHHTPDGQQRVSNCVGDSVTQAGNLTPGTIIDHAERGRCGACTRATPEHNGVVEPEHVFANVHRQYQRH